MNLSDIDNWPFSAGSILSQNFWSDCSWLATSKLLAWHWQFASCFLVTWHYQVARSGRSARRWPVSQLVDAISSADAQTFGAPAESSKQTPSAMNCHPNNSVWTLTKDGCNTVAVSIVWTRKRLLFDLIAIQSLKLRPDRILAANLLESIDLVND